MAVRIGRTSTFGSVRDTVGSPGCHAAGIARVSTARRSLVWFQVDVGHAWVLSLRRRVRVPPVETATSNGAVSSGFMRPSQAAAGWASHIKSPLVARANFGRRVPL